MHLKINALQHMYCWEVVNRPHDEQILHSKFVLRRRRDETGKVVKDEACLLYVATEKMPMIMIVFPGSYPNIYIAVLEIRIRCLS